MSDTKNSNPFATKPSTLTRLEGLVERDSVQLVTTAYGPDGEDLIAKDGPKFSGEPGVKLKVKQGEREDEVVLSPFFGDPSKVSSTEFENGVSCQLYCSNSGKPLDKIPGMSTEEGGEYYAIYLTKRLDKGELVAVNNIWGNTNSRILSEDEVLLLIADSQEGE